MDALGVREKILTPFFWVAWQFQTPIRFPALKKRLILEWEAEKMTNLNELDVRKPLVVSISQRSEELRLYNLV